MVSERAIWTSCILALWGAATVVAAGSDVADAAKKGDKADVRTLLAQKADVNARQPDGDTALHWAAWRDDVELAAMLLRAGANANPVNLTGATPLQLASVNGNAAINYLGHLATDSPLVERASGHVMALSFDYTW